LKEISFEMVAHINSLQFGGEMGNLSFLVCLVINLVGKVPFFCVVDIFLAHDNHDWGITHIYQKG